MSENNPRDVFFSFVMTMVLDQPLQKRSCGECGRVSDLSRCAGCNAAHYCSRSHQRQAWEGHKERCKKVKVTRVSTAQHERTFREKCPGAFERMAGRF